MGRVRVALFIPSMTGGGAERATATIASHLDSRIFAPILLLERDVPHAYEASPRVQIETLGVARSRSTLPRLTAFLRRERVDVLYSALPHLNILAALGRRLVRPMPRLVVSVHSNQRSELVNVRHGSEMRLVMPLVYRSADAVVAVSHGIEDELGDGAAPRRKLRTIYNPVDIEGIALLVRQEVIHPWFDGEHEVITAMGRLSPEKDFATLIRAFASVYRVRSRARLVIMGDGPQASQLASLARSVGAAEAVDLLGFQTNPFAYIARSTCFVMSSVWEGFSLALVEAMASGAAVLATDCAYGPSEILQGGEHGLMARPGDVDGIAAGMMRLIVDEQLRGELVDKGRRRARDFDVSTVIPRYERLFVEITGRP